MAIYSNLTELAAGNHPIFESSLIISSLSGHINDVLVVSIDNSGDTPVITPIDADNCTPVKVLGYVRDENGKQTGLQERYATIAGVKDKVSILGTPELIKDNLTSYTGNPSFFYNKAGNDAKAYEINGDKYGNGDIFGVTTNAFTAGSQTYIKEDAYVILDGNGKYVAQASEPTYANYGFVGQIHSLYTNGFYTLVRIYVLQNVDNNN